MMWKIFRPSMVMAMAVAVVGTMARTGQGVLYLYEPFNYTVGESLGGSGGIPSGQSGTYAGGGSYTWYARGTGSAPASATTHDPAKDAAISSGSLSYTGLATSQGNSVSYGSALPNIAFTSPEPEPDNNLFNKSLYSDSLALPSEVTSGSLYASFIIRVKSPVEDLTNAARHSPVGFVSEASPPTTLGTAMSAQLGTQRMGGFWMRRDPVDAGFTTTNFGVGKTTQDGIGPGTAAPGDNAGWQTSDTSLGFVEDNQFGDKNGQTEPDFNNSATWQTYFVVLKYEFDFANTSADDYDDDGSTPAAAADQADTVSLWMNPGTGTLGVANGEILASANPSGNAGSYYAATDAYTGAFNDMTGIKSFALFGHRLTTNNTFALDIDELRIGTTWADVTPAAQAGIAGDYNGNGVVDGADYVLWRNGGPLLNEVDAPGTVNAADYTAWRARFGNTSGNGSGLGGAAVPEPAAIWLLLAGIAGVLGNLRSRR